MYTEVCSLTTNFTLYSHTHTVAFHLNTFPLQLPSADTQTASYILICGCLSIVDEIWPIVSMYTIQYFLYGLIYISELPCIFSLCCSGRSCCCIRVPKNARSTHCSHLVRKNQRDFRVFTIKEAHT